MENTDKSLKASDAEFFEISAVARLTGISSHVLRVWERRYGVVEPQRSESKRRQYTENDIQRLSLLKTLVDNGHAIGTIASLSTAQLEERLSSVLDARASHDALEESAPAGVCRVGVIGSVLKKPVRDAADSSPALQIVGEFVEVDDLLKSLRPGAIDLIIIEQDTLFPEDIASIQKLITRLEVRRAIVVYQFAREDLIQPLDIQKITALRAPVDPAEIQLACIADIQLALRSGRTVTKSNGADAKPITREPADIPERMFTGEELVQIANFSSVVKCECPQHLANLLSSLTAFEKYSEQCEDRNSDDARLHKYLHETTAKARASMEAALAEVMEQEGIEI